MYIILILNCMQKVLNCFMYFILNVLNVLFHFFYIETIVAINI